MSERAAVSARDEAPRGDALEHRERVRAGLFLLAGWTLIYLVMFDQGATLDLLLGASADTGVFHELFHDGRHLGLVPCH